MGGTRRVLRHAEARRRSRPPDPWVGRILVLYALSLFALGTGVLLVPVPWDDERAVSASFLLWVLPILLVVQAVMLLIPAQVVRRRPVRMRTIAAASVGGAFPMALLLTCSCAFLYLLGAGEGPASWFL